MTNLALNCLKPYLSNTVFPKDFSHQVKTILFPIFPEETSPANMLAE